MNYLIAAHHQWNEGMAGSLSERTGQYFEQISHKNELEADLLSRLSPRYIFFPHWSHIIPESVFARYESVIFHMTDVPFGRGGSPLQNLITRGIYETQISALRCERNFDAGPVYLKTPLSLYGSAEEIYIRARGLVEDMIAEIVRNEPTPTLQEGEIVTFPRRKPEQGNLADVRGLDQAFDHIRMLDAEGYPHAFIEAGNLRFEFTRAARRTDGVYADVRILEIKR